MNNMSPNYTSKHVVLLIKVIIPLLLVILFLGLMGVTLSHNQTFTNDLALATTNKPEDFTETYFDNHTQLPETVTKGQTITFSFTTHNLENKQFTYPYKVYVDDNGTQTLIDQGTFTLENNQYKTLPESYTFIKSVGKVKMVVELTSLQQQIFFWLNNTYDAPPYVVQESTSSANPSPAVDITSKLVTQNQKKPIDLNFNEKNPPPSVIIAHKPVTFSFDIHNIFGWQFIYPYEVYINVDGKTSQLDSNQVLLNASQTKTITETYTLPAPAKTVQIYVVNPVEQEYISYKTKGG